MLTPPITQRDVDEGTVFVQASGSVISIAGKSGELSHPWMGSDCNFYSSRGLRGAESSSRTNLISRQPKGEKMESQVVVVDKRVRVYVPFRDIPLCSLFRAGEERMVRLKVGADHSLIITGGTPLLHVTHHEGNRDGFSTCEVLSDLRLTLTLRNV